MKLEQIQQFKIFVKTNHSKLQATDIVKLKKNVFLQYLQKIKHYAGKQTKYQTKNKINTHSKLTTNPKQKHSKQYETQTIMEKIMKGKPAQKIRSRSVYYNQKIELNSLKQLVFLAQESNKRQAKEKILSRRHYNSNYLKTVQKQIQTFGGTNSITNLRLTMKSAGNIMRKYSQKKMFNPQSRHRSRQNQI